MKLSSHLISIAKEACQILFPRRCATCHSMLTNDDILDLCNECKTTLVYNTSNACFTCGKRIDGETGGAEVLQCGECRIATPPFDRVVFSMPYIGTFRKLLHSFKFARKAGLASTIAPLMCSALHRSGYTKDLDFIIPIPLHSSRLYHRGFNQSALLGFEIGKAFTLMVKPGLLVRRVNTEAQSSKTRKQRFNNIRNAFSVSTLGEINGKNILLVDDIMTTGATLHEAARTLKKAGATHITCLVAARV